MSSVTDGVTACIVTYNSARCIARCLEALDAQTRRPARVLVWDNASADESATLARRYGADVVLSETNVGFARAANELVHRTTTRYVLMLNPDAYLRPGYVEHLERAADADPAIGSLTGKLVRPSRGSEVPILDSTGHVLYRNRVLENRGEREPDRGQHDTAGEVFGVCAAAALYRRAMLDDVCVGTEYFDSTFFAYLEDADLDWRARLRGWKAHYVPDAIAQHERGHPGDRRRQTALTIQHSLKNRYLTILRNDRPADLLRDAGPIIVAETLRLLDYCFANPASLAGYVRALRCLPRALAARQQIQRRRVVGGAAIRAWAQPYPLAKRLRQRVSRTLGSPPR